MRIAVDSDPEVVGKPGPLMYELAARQLGQDAAHTLGVGDRLDTDIAERMPQGWIHCSC